MKIILLFFLLIPSLSLGNYDKISEKRIYICQTIYKFSDSLNSNLDLYLEDHNNNLNHYFYDRRDVDIRKNKREPELIYIVDINGKTIIEKSRELDPFTNRFKQNQDIYLEIGNIHRSQYYIYFDIPAVNSSKIYKDRYYKFKLYFLSNNEIHFHKTFIIRGYLEHQTGRCS